MPFDATIKALVGDEATAPLEWARGVLCQWLADKLNDPLGPYAGKLGITATRKAIVSDNGEIVAAMYGRKDSPPVVSLLQGPSNARQWYCLVGEQEREGERVEVEWTLDMGVNDAEPDEDDVALQRSDDANLAGFVRDALRRGYIELNGLGLFNLDIEPDAEKQRAGQMRNPHAVTFFLRLLYDFQT
jgi:hypothetical protein